MDWFPMCQKIDFKIQLLVYKALNCLLVRYEALIPLRLSGTGLFTVSRIRTKQGEATFSFYAPTNIVDVLILTWTCLKFLCPFSLSTLCTCLWIQAQFITSNTTLKRKSLWSLAVINLHPSSSPKLLGNIEQHRSNKDHASVQMWREREKGWKA